MRDYTEIWLKCAVVHKPITLTEHIVALSMFIIHQVFPSQYIIIYVSEYYTIYNITHWYFQRRFRNFQSEIRAVDATSADAEKKNIVMEWKTKTERAYVNIAEQPR